MKIAGYEKLSLQDFPNHISCIIFTQGCNMRCPFCQNSTLIPQDANNLINEEEVLNYLNTRKNLINGLTISGGEPTLQSDLEDFIDKVRELGLKIKLDTNGLNTKILENLIKNSKVDYVAMDIKNSLNKYGLTSGVSNIIIQNILKSIELLKNSKIEYEFRTTIISEYHTLQDILEIIKLIGDSKYYLQNFKISEYVLNKNLTSFTEEKLNLWNKILKDYPNVYIRGLEKE